MNKIQQFEMWLSHMDNKLEQANKEGVPLIVKDMKKEKYNQGYLPKMHYWYGKLLKAATPLEQATALSKLNHFKKRHYQMYGVWVGVEELSHGVEHE